MKKSSRGFTLIELLVVIAIIGVLSSVVLASLNTARAKGSDAAIKANLNGIRAQAELVADAGTTVSYAAVCDNANVVNALTAATGAGGVTSCFDDADAWAAASKLKASTEYYCVDSTGNTKVSATLTIAADDFVCN